MSVASSSHPYRQQVRPSQDNQSTAGLLKETSVLLANRVKAHQNNNMDNSSPQYSNPSSGNTYQSATQSINNYEQGGFIQDDVPGAPPVPTAEAYHEVPQISAQQDYQQQYQQDYQQQYPQQQGQQIKETFVFADPNHQQQQQVPYIPPPPTIQSHNMVNSNGVPTPRSSVDSAGTNQRQAIFNNHQVNDSSSTTSIPRAPDTPVGARSFSSPPIQHLSLDYQTRSEENLSSRSQSPPNSQGYSTVSSKKHNRASKSVDLSHLYLLDRNESTHFTLTNESLSDVSQNLIRQYLGENSSSSLLPRMKTIEMYRKNVKKSNDPKVLFQYAQYMLQTSLTIDNTRPDATKEEVDLKKQFLKEAVHYLKKLSDKGYIDAQYLLGDAHSSGALGKIDNKEAFNLFHVAAKHGHVESAYRTSYCYEEGLGVGRDSRRALEFLKFAASKNHPASMYKLGVYSFHSRMGLADNVNVKKNGIQWLSRATSKANELTNGAPYELAKINEKGFLDIVIPDRKYAMELYIQAASLGHIKSAAILGKAYELGDEVIPQDADLSIHYYTQAALGGDAESMLSLCAWYLVGNPPNLEKDEKEAFQWALRAANQGLPKGQFAVGNFFEKGLGIEKDLNTAKQWYEKAALNHDERAQNRLNKLNGVNIQYNNKTIKKLRKKASSGSIDKLAQEEKDKNCIIM
ncbi:hypothetical protein BN7_4780 [Wickerhamomyces ciferrii]|uniref:Protein SKT5 n=1 Tax=Wickerhamomyces ciferrii (strain ATCC 14091 / BCRC 22168 / CBS 111 / JCM 3599 / NBRC 0793 / NRRL Y-1031 F-60-10) TaxID=1206466 RepID=K0KUU0_WICCF|nr:uncharacterized protein BN7_4780 [Wickerhamomyces ciferrii]CCH45199.1 hypothetical protein BN7_4780 [Wickerhamomyces ciferrii]